MKRSVLGGLALTFLSVAASVSTLILSPLFLMLLYRRHGRGAFVFWFGLTAVLLVTFAPFAMASSYLAAGLLAGLFCESEASGHTFSTSALTAVLSLMGSIVLGLAIAVKKFNFNPATYFREQLDLALAQIPPAALGGATVDKEMLFQQIPSAIFVTVVVSMWINYVLASRVEKVFFETTVAPSKPEESLADWKLPDSFVLVALVSTALAFLKFDGSDTIRVVGANVFNVCAILYFFQGLAVVVSFMKARAVGGLWRAFFYFLIFTQFFLMVAILGLVDFWMDFRKRMKTPPRTQQPSWPPSEPPSS